MLKKIKFFSIPTDVIYPGLHLDFDLYVNSSTVEGRERYYRIFKHGHIVEERFYLEHIQKHQHLYVPEHQRKKYFSSVIQKQAKNKEKVEAIKSIAIDHMIHVFENETNSDKILSHVQKSKDVVDLIVDLVQDQSMNDLYKVIGAHCVSFYLTIIIFFLRA